VEHKTTHVNEIAIMNTGRVICDVDADIVAVIEAEHRVALKQFSDFVLTKVGSKPYPNVMLIDGNDARGIDVGLMTKSGYAIGSMRSHIPYIQTLHAKSYPPHDIKTNTFPDRLTIRSMRE
jgi:hypothetical protein